jgi:hypothetical protein
MKLYFNSCPMLKCCYTSLHLRILWLGESNWNLKELNHETT